MASGGSDRQTGTVPKTKGRNNCNVPQEVVTPTRRDMHSGNIVNTSVDWLPVSEQNSRPSQNRTRKPTNISTDNDFTDLDSPATHEGNSRFVPVRPQPRTLVLRQRDNIMETSEDSSSYNSILGGHSPHTSHTAIMIVNPTTPNSNQTNQNLNSSGSGNRSNIRGASVGRDTYSNNTAGAVLHPVNNNNSKPTNICNDTHETVYQNGNGHNYHDNIQNHSMENVHPRTEAARAIGDNLVAACPDTARVEQRLGQIREYIRVTSTLVESMRNSEDEEAMARPTSAQSSISAYSENDMWQKDMEMTQLRLAAALQEQKRLLKYQAEAKEQLAEMHMNRNMETSNSSHGEMSNHQEVPSHSLSYHPPAAAGQPQARVYGSNQIGVATTLPHVSENNHNNYNWNNQGVPKRCSTSRDRELNERSSRGSSEAKNKGLAVAIVSSDQGEIDMLRDLQMRRQHLESQVAKIQNLHAATSSLADAVSTTPGGADEGMGRSAAGWGGSEASEEDASGTVESNIRSKVAAVNVMKVELERLKSMLRTVDSIQNNFGINSVLDDDNLYDNTSSQVHHDNQIRNRNRVSESSVSNIPLCRTDSSSSNKRIKDGLAGNTSACPKNQNTPLGLSRLQNCISSGSNKCTNVSEQNQTTGDNVGAGLAVIQQLTHELKQAAQGLSDERRRLKHATNRDICTSSGSSIKSDDKKRTNSLSGGDVNIPFSATVNYPGYSGPIERKQLALKAELEAKKKQLERLMSKEVDHRTNQQAPTSDIRNPSKAPSVGPEESTLPHSVPQAPAMAPVARTDDDCSCQGITMRTDIDNGYSSDQDEDEAYLSSTRNQLNINQLGMGPSIKLPSRGSSPDNFKDPCYFGDSTQSLDGSFVSQNMKRNKLQQQQRVNLVSSGAVTASGSSGKQHNRETQSQEIMSMPQDGVAVETAGQDMQHPRTDCFLTLPMSNVGSARRNKDVCDVSNISNGSSTSSGGDRDPVPPPMAALPPRHRQTTKINKDNLNPTSGGTPQWHNPHSESQVTMWWHNKANQLQQQLEMTSNLCQSLLQDRRAGGQTSPSTSQATNPSQSMTMSNYPMMLPPNPLVFNPYQSNPVFNPGLCGLGVPPNPGLGLPLYPAAVTAELWGLQQQMVAQQQQAAAAAWGSAHCIQHLLSQQREISMLRNTLNNLEEKMHALNMNMPRAHSTPPTVNFPENTTNPPTVRANSALSNVQPQTWNAHSQMHPSGSESSYLPMHTHGNVHSSNMNHTRMVKPTPSIPPFPVDTFTNQVPANFSFPSNIFQNEHLGEQHSNVSMVNQPLYNNCVPPQPLNPNIMSNQSLPQPIQNNRNPNCLLNLTPHGPHPLSVPLGGSQPLSGQSTALNNQVPPGNRANNYWDNFRSYSRQNLLSGSSKVNADTSFPTHSPQPHPLVERSHNTLHSSSSTTTVAASQSSNTPKRNINNLVGNIVESTGEATYQRRGRRNLTQDMYFTAPPDVLNVNQNHDMETNQVATNVPPNAEDITNVLDRINSSVNVNLNRLSTNPVPEIIQAHSNNLNIPRSYGAHKKKSSSKLPAKNASNAGNYSLDYTQNRNVELNADHAVFNPNLASTSSANSQEKSTTKLFDLLRENVYSEVTALISANESRPHFLIQLFRDLQQISSDTLRQRALQSIQELVSHYLSAVETELYESNEEHRNLQRAPSLNNDNQVGTANHPNDAAILGLDIDNEIVRFILQHHSDVCTGELLEALRNVIMSTIGNPNDHTHLDQSLRNCFTKYQGCKLMGISDDLVVTISKILSTVDSKNQRSVNAIPSENIENTIEINNPNEQRLEVLQPYPENASNDRHFMVNLPENGEISLAGNRAEGISETVHEVSSFSHPQQQEVAGRFSNMAESKIDLIESVETYNGDLAEADQSRHGSETTAASVDGNLEGFLPDVVDTEEQTPTEAEAEWLGLDRVPMCLLMEDNPGNQSDCSQT